MAGKPKLNQKAVKAIDREIARYLKTGDYDEHHSAWPSYSYLERANEMGQRIEDALVAEVRKREDGQTSHKLPKRFNAKTFSRKKVTPMVTGLFPAKERETILDLLQDSLVFLTRDNIEQVLREEQWKHTAWDLANLYLGSIGAKCLNGKPSYLVGLSQATTCYVSMTYFDEDDPFADFVVHEAAHVFHNWKRERVGLPHTRHKEWLLQIDFAKREEFAYACEAYGRIIEQAKSPADRRRLHAEYAENHVPGSDDRVDRDELVDILAEAVEARNGWKRILNRCAAPKPIPKSVWIKQSVEAAMRNKKLGYK